MKKVILIIAILTVSLGFSQNTTRAQNKALEAYKVAFNNNDYKGIYALYSDVFQSTTTVNRVKISAERLKKASGKITSLIALNKPEKEFETFKAIFNKKNKVYKMMVKFNSENQIDYVSFNTQL